MRKKPFLPLFLSLMLSFGACAPADSGEPEGAVAAASRLLERVLPAARGSDFVIEEIAPVEGRDVFALETVNSKLVVRGNNAVAVATGSSYSIFTGRRTQPGTRPRSSTASPGSGT